MKLTLTNKALAFLVSVIEAPGWAKSTDLIYRGGQLLCEVFPDQSDKPEFEKRKNEVGEVVVEPRDKKAYDAWGSVSREFELTDKQLETCKTALRHFAEAGAITPAKHTLELLRAFSLSPE